MDQKLAGVSCGQAGTLVQTDMLFLGERIVYANTSFIKLYLNPVNSDWQLLFCLQGRLLLS